MSRDIQLPANQTLQTPRCLLRRMEIGDAESVFSALSTPGFTDGLLQEPLKDAVAAVVLIGTYLAAWNNGTRFVFAITDGDRNFVGMINLFRRDQPGLWSVGFWIMPEQWGKGFATEAARAIIDLAFRRVAAHVVHAAHVHSNLQSQRVLAKLGMRFTLRREHGISKNGQWIPNLHYEMTKAEWESAVTRQGL
jgi:ribosomal-protein-alanine N-acetyltransferase